MLHCLHCDSIPFLNVLPLGFQVDATVADAAVAAVAAAKRTVGLITISF